MRCNDESNRDHQMADQQIALTSDQIIIAQPQQQPAAPQRSRRRYSLKMFSSQGLCAC